MQPRGLCPAGGPPRRRPAPPRGRAPPLSNPRPPLFGAIGGKSRVYTPDSGAVYTSIRPETIKAVDESVRDYWILEACRALRKRLDAVGEAQRMDPGAKEGLL